MSKENGTEANIITKKTKSQACVARGAGTSSIVIIQIYIYIYIYIYAYGAQCFLEGNKMKCSKSATTLQDSASDTDGKQTPDIYL
jgi:tetrahydromethanopterin S-methyltransferase subunit D